MRKVISVILVFSILLLSGNLFAKERKGAGLIIQKTDGQQVRGELIAVKQTSLLLLERESGADVTVDVSEIKVVRIVKKSKAGVGLLAGGVIGAFVGYQAYLKPVPRPYLKGWESAIYHSFSNSMDTGPGVFAVVGGALGVLIGLGLGAVEGTDKTFQFEGMSDSEIKEILEKLRKKARVRNAR